MRRAEAASGGEIVVTVAERCDDYPEAAWRAATGGALFGLALAAAAHALIGTWGGAPLLWGLLPGLAGAAAGWLAQLVPAVRRLLLDAPTVQRRVEREAGAAFLAAEVFATRDRTGILLFVALFEHRVVVLGDAGLTASVPPAAWRAVSDRLAASLRRGALAEGLVEAVDACGALLVERVPRRPDDRNELPDRPRRHDAT